MRLCTRGHWSTYWGEVPSPEVKAVLGNVPLDHLTVGTVRIWGRMMANPDVYDKAKWHYDGDYPDGLPQSQAFVHIGMFLAWLIQHDMYSDELCDDFGEEIAALKSGRITGARLLERADGVFSDDMLNDEGNAFTRYYYGLPGGPAPYLPDYEATFASSTPTLYHVDDTWDNYGRIAAVLDRRYQEWVSAGRPHARTGPPPDRRVPTPRHFWQGHYVLYLVLGKSAALHVYDWAVWRDIAPLLDPIIAVARGRASVRSTQLDRATHRPVTFGRLFWDDKSHMRWTHSSPLTNGASDHWSFFATEVWAPHWRVCEREDRAPDVFVHVHAEHQAEGKPFDQEVLIAAREEMPRAVLERHLPQATGRIAELMNGVLTATTTAQWGQSTSGGIGFTDAIQDFVQGGLHRARSAHEAPTVLLLPGIWRQVES